jgi:uncharacterized protein (TIGR02145 family)
MNQKLRNLKFPLIAIGLFVLITTSCKKDEGGNTESAQTIKDKDGNAYKTVKIGKQIWMAENLRTTTYNDGTKIPLVTNDTAWTKLTTPGYCQYYNTKNADSIKKFGAIYNFYAVDTKKLAPIGWHVPTSADWDTLKSYLFGNKIAKSLSANTDWLKSRNPGAIGNDLTKNNKSGFSAIPMGSRVSSANTFAHFSDSYEYCDMWASTPSGTIGGYYVRLCYDFEYFDYSKSIAPNISGHPVRLVKD